MALMFSAAILALVAAYMGLLFLVAWRTEHGGFRAGSFRGLGYALSLAIYCTSWTYYGAVGTAARAGWEFLPIYLGPVIGLTLLFPLWRRIASAARRENVGSIADFLSSRYGKSQSLGAVVAVVAIVGSIPYIALQLKSLSMSWQLVTAGTPVEGSERLTVPVIAATLAFFAILFGARRPDLTEHNRGLIRAITLESVVKLAALTAVAVFALILLFGADPTERIIALGELAYPPDIDNRFLAITVLATLAIFCLPRQFHVGFVESAEPADVRRARWVFPLYLLITTLAVLPLVAAGGLFLPGVEPDVLVLALPFSHAAPILTSIVFVGGFSAATAMVIVETVALSAMASNSLILPLLARDRWRRRGRSADMGRIILLVRRIAMIVLMVLAWLYFQATDRASGLAQIGLTSFAALAQLAPALFGAVLWRDGKAAGAMAGIVVGTVLWAVLLAWPQLAPQFGLATAQLVAGDPLPLGVFVSLTANTLVYVLVSRLAAPRLIDRVQARAFVDRLGPDWGEPRPAMGGATVGDLKVLVSRFIGDDGADRAFSAWARETGRKLNPHEPADATLARAAERMLSGAVGASTARRVIGGALAGGGRAPEDVVRLLDEASEAVQFNRELLQTALDNIDQGVSMVDEDLRLIAWNRRYLEMFDLPPAFVHVGLPISEVYRLNAERGEVADDVSAWVERRLEALRRRIPHVQERQRPDGRILRSSGAPIPGAGYVTSYTDITELRRAAVALQEANEQLEARVADRTEKLAEAKRQAEAATASKTRFLAAASHDLLQPLHAARLFIAALREEADDEAVTGLARNADRSIESAHRLLTALLNLSKLEAGGVKPAVGPLPLADLFEELRGEYQPLAAAKGLTLTVDSCAFWTASDRDLLRSMLQNLIGNAVRYTDSGGVHVACRPAADGLRIEVSDTGRGIPQERQAEIFAEFTRLPGRATDEPGAGLGLAIVARLSALLSHPVDLTSEVGRGSTFSIRLPLAPAAVAPREEPIARPGAALKGLRVLCTDNEPAILDGLSALLGRWGAAAVTAPDVASALAATGEFDAALVDLHLGDGPDGLSLVPALRARGVPKIALISADTDETLRDRAAAAGAVLLRKPVKPAALKAFLSARG